MSEHLLLAALNSLEVKNLDDESLTNVAKSLEAIIENDTFNGLMQEAAFCKLTLIQETMGARAAVLMEHDKKLVERLKAAQKIMREKDKEVEEPPPGSNESDNLIRLMIRSEEDGSLSFEFRGIKWDFNHDKGRWDFTPPPKK
jgi:hypothetical protein